MSDLLLDINNLEIKFHTQGEETAAVNNISFQLNKGETVGIVGESGSGKSVTSLAVMGLIPSPPGRITNGSIDFYENDEAVDLVTLSQEDFRQYRGNKIAMIFQEPMTSLNPVFTCGDQVMEAILLHQKLSKEEAKQKTIELFEEVLLPRPNEIFDTYPHQISGGQKQRVMIAMALSCEPDILIADEPTTALDVTVQKAILELMTELQEKRNMGIIFITHDLGVIADLADKVVVMYKGDIVENGSVEEIFKNPKHPYTQGLLACRPPLNERYAKLPVVGDFLAHEENGEMVTKFSSLDEFIKDIKISSEDRKVRLEKLYQQEPILEVNNLKTFFPLKTDFFGRTKEFVKAVNDVSFKVYPGETLGLVGESGCGKTTTGRTILRLIEPTNGEIIYKGTNIVDLGRKELRELRKNIQIIFQDPYSSLNPRKTIGNAILEPMQVHNILNTKSERKEYVIDLLEKVNLSADHFNRYPHEFSGGQRQRICIARTLAVQPEFIICDESVSALDVSVQAQVLNLLNDLKKEFNLTYIFISHDLSVVKFMCDRMIVMNKNGQIEQEGESDDVYANPQTEYTKKLIEAIPKGIY